MYEGGNYGGFQSAICPLGMHWVSTLIQTNTQQDMRLPGPTQTTHFSALFPIHNQRNNTTKDFMVLFLTHSCKSAPFSKSVQVSGD